MKRALRKAYHILRSAASRIHIDLNNDSKHTVFLAGTGRSGTAWIANVINYDNSYRYIFEPFNPYRVPAVAQFRYRQYLRPADRDPVYVEPAEKILTGRWSNAWIDGWNRRMVSSRRLVKDIRANLLLKWIRALFPSMPIVLLLRHPCADAVSRMELGWGTHVDEVLAQPDLMADFMTPFGDVLRSAKTDFEKHILLWCAENYVPLHQFARGELHLAFYEHFCERPKAEIDRLFQYLGRPYRAEIFERLSSPSPMSREDSAIFTGGALIDGWRKSLTEAQMLRANELVRQFGLDRVYTLDPMPDAAGAEALLRPDAA